VPVVTTTATANVGVSASVNYLEVGLKLDVEPTVHLSDEVAIKVGLEVSNILETIDLLNTRAYRLGTRNASTVLRLRDGETQVLAGLISDDDRRAGNKVPGLGELPVVGRLFGSQLDNQTKTEIVLLITPRVVRNINRPEAFNLEYQSGTEAAIGSAPLRLSGSIDSGVAIGPSAPGAAGAQPPAPPARRDAPALAPPPPAAPDVTALAKPVVPPDPAASRIALTAPAQVGIGSAFGVSVALPAGANAASSELELGYDARLLQVIGVGGGGADPVTIVPTQPGRLLLRTKSSGQGGNEPITVQFRVIASGAAETQVALSSAQVLDQQGKPLALTAPPPHALRIGQ
jgi:general secretion pathway protein D